MNTAAPGLAAAATACLLRFDMLINPATRADSTARAVMVAPTVKNNANISSGAKSSLEMGKAAMTANMTTRNPVRPRSFCDRLRRAPGIATNCGGRPAAVTGAACGNGSFDAGSCAYSCMVPSETESIRNERIRRAFRR